METVEALLGLVHAKYLKLASDTMVHEGQAFEELCQRLAIQDIASFSTALSRPTSDEEGDRNVQDLEMLPKAHEVEAKRRPIRQRYPTSKYRSHPEKMQPKLGRKKKHRSSCGDCLGCTRDEDCGECDLCLDKPKFGGPGTKKQRCELRRCEFKNSTNILHMGRLRQEDPKEKEKGLHSNSDALSAMRANRVTRGASKQLTATQQNNSGGRDQTKPTKSTDKKKVKELFITRNNVKTLQNHQNDKNPDHSPETLPKRMKQLELGNSAPMAEFGSRQSLKCYICGKPESGRSNLYGHYAGSHFRDQLIELLDADRKHCEKHNVTFENDAHMVIHFGRVHDHSRKKVDPSNPVPVFFGQNSILFFKIWKFSTKWSCAILRKTARDNAI